MRFGCPFQGYHHLVQEPRRVQAAAVVGPVDHRVALAPGLAACLKTAETEEVQGLRHTWVDRSEASKGLVHPLTKDSPMRWVPLVSETSRLAPEARGFCGLSNTGSRDAAEGRAPFLLVVYSGLPRLHDT